MLKYDISLFYLINGWARKWRFLDYFGVFCAVYLIWLMALAVLVFFWQAPREISRWKCASVLVISGAASYMINVLIGFGSGRIRPFGGIDGVNHLIPVSFLHKSFPSSHATVAFAMAFTVFFFDKSWGIPLIVAAVLVSLGRVYVGVHYPLDVLAGAALGGVISFIVYKIII